MSDSAIRRLLRYSRSDRRSVYLASFYSVLNKIFDLAPPLLIGAAVDSVVNSKTAFFARFGYPDTMSQLAVISILTIVIWGLESLFEYLFSIEWRNLAQRIQHRLRLDAFSHLQKLDLQVFENESTGNLLSILNDDVNQLERFLDKGANDIIQVVTTSIVIGIIFFMFAPLVAAFSIVPVPFVLWGSFYFQKKLVPRYASVREKVGALNADLANVISGIAVVKSFNAEPREVERIQNLSKEYCLANAQAIALSSAFSPLIRMVILVGFVITLLLGGYLCVNGELAVGSYSVLIFLIQRLLWPLTSLGETFDLYQRAMASTSRILDLLDLPIKIRGGSDGNSVDVPVQVTVEKLGFTYPQGQKIFHDLSLEFLAGKVTGIVGLTGSGKSTLVKLLLRFYDPQTGKINFNSQPITDLSLARLRNSISLVSQDVFLFHGTILENIAYGDPKATRDQIETAAHLAEAFEFVQQFEKGFDTIVGERGQKLSGGQRQRISLARAILKDAPLLILDEATSSVDNETEAAIQRSLQKVSRGKTTIVIAHRLSTIRNAARIYVLDRGTVSEYGTHDELVKTKGGYHHLWSVQTGE